MKKLTLLLVLIFGFVGNKSFASHQSAADIYYDYISPLKYRVHLIIYRDCTGVNQGPSESISVYSPSLGQTATSGCNITLDTTGNGPTGVEVGDICPGIGTKCTNPSSLFNGYEEWHYSGIVDLPAVAKDWRFEWSSCCRNPAIDNIPQNGMTVYALLNNVDRPVNSSVRLSQKPIPYVCLNQPYLYINGPFDPDGDLINCINGFPLDGGQNCTNSAEDPYTHIFPYTLAAPLASSSTPAYSLSLTTGTASFTPNLIGAYVLNFRFFDIAANGDTLGMSMRDVQLNVANCVAPPPQPLYTLGYNVTNVVGGVLDTTGGVNTVTICPGVPLSFDVSAFTISGSNNLYGTANNAIATPGSSVSFSPPGAAVTGSYSWIPPGNASNNTLVFSFNDSTCTIAQPIVLKAFIIVKLIVLPGVSGGGPYNYCPGGDSVLLSATGAPGMNIWSWQALPSVTGNPNFSNANGQSTNIAPTGAPPGVMKIQVTGLPAITGCSNIDTIDVNIYDSLILSAGSDKSLCANDPVTLNGSTNKPNGVVLWTPNLFLNNGTIITPTCTPLASQEYELKYTDPNGCVARDTVNVVTNGVKPILNAISERDTVCPDIPFQLFSNASAQPCGISRFQCNANTPPSNYSVGNGNIANSNFSPFYRDFGSGFRTQYLYRASELKAAGMEAGIIKGIAFDVINNSTAAPLTQYRVKMGCTSLDEFGATGYVNGLPTVFSANTFNPTIGTTAINFSPNSEFFWDGSSNLVLEVCYSLPQFSGGLPSDVKSEITSYNSSIGASDLSNGCTLPSAVASIASVRPNTIFNSCPVSLFNYTWSPASAFNNNTLKDPTVQNGIVNTTTFTVTAVSATNSNCVSTDNVTVSLDLSGSVTATATPPHLCEPGLVTLTATPNASAPQYACGEENVNCIAGTNMIPAGTGNLSAIGVGPFTNFSQGSKTQWMFTPAELIGFGFSANSRIDSLGVNVVFNSGTAYNNFKIKLGCTKASNLSGLIGSSNFKTVYEIPTIAPVFGWNTFKFGQPFVWDGTSNLVVEFCFFNGGFGGGTDLAYSNTAPNIFEIEATSNDGGCDLPFVGNVNFTTSRTLRPDTRFYACQVAPKPFTYIWDNPIASGNDLYYNDSTKQTTQAYVPYNSSYQVSLLNRTGCKRSDTVQVQIVEHDITVSPTDTVLCPEDRFLAYAYPTGTDANPSLSWTPTSGLSNPNGLSTEIAPTASTLYSVIRSDIFNCKDTATVNVIVRNNPNVTITQGDSILIGYSSPTALNATGAYIYTWSPSWGLSTTNQANTTVSPTAPGYYYVYGIDTNGCRNTDSIWVDVNYRSPVFLANAFTPNGDGVNDFFGVTNLKFQKVQTFIIYDRFGNEVFNTIDSKGWDGKFRGKDLDMDTYYYFIKLVYPDGYIDTYKGDVILIR